MTESLPTFKTALRHFTNTHDVHAPDFEAQYALFAAWWFIENISQDAPDRTEVFFLLRNIVRSTPEAKS